MSWWKIWRLGKREELAGTRLGELREFVYLDEVSVLSLLASRVGSVVLGRTDNNLRALKLQAAGKAKKKILVAEGEVSGAITGDFSQASSVERKAIIQASFKELVDLETSRLIIGALDLRQSPVPLHTLRVQSGSLRKSGCMHSPEELKRGTLIELDIELDVEAVYRMNTVVSAMLGIVDGSPTLFDATTKAQFEQGRAVEGVLRGLLGGLVPIRARVPDCRVFPSEGKEMIIHRAGLTEDDWKDGAELVVVGVAEESLFWKDLRRVLYSGGRYKVLARVGKTGLQDSWTPIKLSQVLDSIAPELGEQIDDASSMILKNDHPKQVAVSSTLGPPLAGLLELLCEKAGPSLSTDRRTAAQQLVDSNAGRSRERSTLREVSHQIADALFLPSERPSNDELVEIRERVFDLDEVTVEPDASHNEPSPPSPPRYLDCEFVAIYW